MNAKINRALRIIAKQYAKFLNELDDHISLSRVGKGNLAKELSMSYKTFYRKLKNRTFSNSEIQQIADLVNKAYEKRDKKSDDITT